MKKETIDNKKSTTTENLDPVLPVDNDIRVVIKSKEDGVLFDQDCCTVINIILNNYNEIATSFLGIHNEEIIKQLWKAQKAYFKALKKTLKEERKKIGKTIDSEENNVEPKKDTKKDSIYHIKEFENNNQSNKNQEHNCVIDSSEPSFDHVCDKDGCRLIKKKINPKKTEATQPQKKSKNKKQTK